MLKPDLIMHNDSKTPPPSGGENGQRPQEPNGPKPQPGLPPARPRRQLMTWVLLFAFVAVIWAIASGGNGNETSITWTEFQTLATAQPSKLEPGSITIDDTRIAATVKPNMTGFDEEKPTAIYVTLAAGTTELFTSKIEDLGLKYAMLQPDRFWSILLMQFGPILLVLLIIWFVIARSMRNSSGGPGGMLGNFGKSKHRLSTKDAATVSFDDVAGVDEAKEEVTELVSFLKDPKRFQRLGGRIPRGVLLEGLPGCGKTLLAKAIAGEADVPFFTISGSDFVEMFVGVGASRVRDLFKQAKENSPCIIFLDEIDAVGRRRGGGSTTGGHDEREQTLNAILVEMDGFEATDQVIVIAATNRVDVLDPALTRPGRFDRTVAVSLPDIKGRAKILAVHAKKVKIGPDVDFERIARGTPGFSGADLAALINEAAILATMQDKDFVELDDLEEARDKVRWGRSRRSRKVEEEDRVLTAYHEAGHAVVQALLDDADPLHKVTIIPRGSSGGATFSLPDKDRMGFGRKYLDATLRVLCGGRIAEQKKTKDVSSGASMDIRMATQYARAMVLEWGMSERVGFINYAPNDQRELMFGEKDYSDDTARVIDEEVRAILDSAYDDCTRLIDGNWDAIVAVAEALLSHETLSRDEVERLMKGETLDKPTLADLLSQEASKTPPPPTPTDAADDAEEDLGGMIPSPA
jgi:cell division protease FtsH